MIRCFFILILFLSGCCTPQKNIQNQEISVSSNTSTTKEETMKQTSLPPIPPDKEKKQSIGELLNQKSINQNQASDIFRTLKLNLVMDKAFLELDETLKLFLTDSSSPFHTAAWSLILKHPVLKQEHLGKKDWLFRQWLSAMEFSKEKDLFIVEKMADAPLSGKKEIKEYLISKYKTNLGSNYQLWKDLISGNRTPGKSKF
jgi:hypothetical protein